MEFIPPPPRSDLRWLGIDLDGTLAEPLWTPENPTTDIGEPIWENVEKARHAVDQGFKLFIHTSRPWTDYETIKNWLEHYKIEFKEIQCGKPLFRTYVDDRAVNADDMDWTKPSTVDQRQKELDFMWLVGLFEGEGCIYINQDQTRVTLTITMCDKDVVERVAAYFGSNISFKKTKEDKWRDAYQCCVSQRLIVKDFLTRALPYLGDRRAAKALTALRCLDELLNPIKKKRTEKHGTYSEYSNYACRCEPCVIAGHEYQKQHHKKVKSAKNAKARARYATRKTRTKD